MQIWLLGLVVCAKLIVQTVTLTPGQQWAYFAKFALDIGTGAFRLRAKLLSPVDPNSGQEWPFSLPIYLDSRWDEALDQLTCEGRLRSAKVQKLLPVPKDGTWSDEISGNISQFVRPYFWFFAVADCSQALSSPAILRLEIIIVNADGSHYSMQEQHSAWIYAAALTSFICVLVSNFCVLREQYKTKMTGEVLEMVLIGAISTQIVAILCVWSHHFQLGNDAQGLIYFDFVGQSLDLVSQLIVTLFLLLLISGWTDLAQALPTAQKSLPIALLLVLVEFITAGISRWSEEEYDKFSEFDGISGNLLVVIRLGLLGVFVYCAKQQYNASQGVKQTLLVRFSLLASLYFLAVPGISFTSYLFAQYIRKPAVLIGNYSVQFLAFISLSRLFNEKNEFNRVSTCSSSALPSSKRH